MARRWPPGFAVLGGARNKFGRLTSTSMGGGGGDPRVGINLRVGPYTWTASGSGTGEFYLLQSAGNPSIALPVAVTLGGILAVKGSALGSLSASQWQYGNNDTLGFSTLYVRLADDADPDSKAIAWVIALRTIDGY